MKIKACCQTCMFSREGIVSGSKVLECHFNAPQVLSGSGTGWSPQLFPMVFSDNWCGKFEVNQNLLKENGNASEEANKE
jgi:hypothetical protein